MSIGGIFGALMAAALNGNVHPSVSFFSSGIIGLILVIFSLQLSAKVEQSDEEATKKRLSFMEDVKGNMRDIYEALKIKEFYSVLLYLVLKGVSVPSFSAFGYYFQTDVLKVS